MCKSTLTDAVELTDILWLTNQLSRAFRQCLHETCDLKGTCPSLTTDHRRLQKPKQTTVKKTRINSSMNNAMDTKIDVDQESNKQASIAGVDDMPTGFRFLSGQDRKQFAKKSGRAVP